ncbi:response regulator transcription factor [Fulvivirga kasyanovii]|uniref:Response regulator transcription factor n=2 Tax=Fulvivirga kasyanovii TaxID=396812 RepID=A0ABW9RLA9_9BACT|nr:response regulator transcription factor [Fulvivirga kasyanovii]
MGRVKQILLKSKYIMIYGASMAALIFVLKWMQWKYLIADNSLEIYIGLIAVFFTILGVWVANQLSRRRVRTVVVEKEVYRSLQEDGIDEIELKKLNLTAREYEVLQLITQGHTNAEIAEKLFLSLSTIKTHVSNLFVKMDVKSRTQAVEKANRLRLTA